MNLLPALALATLFSDDACSARLDHLLTVYREYGLPVPPPDAVLVRGQDERGADAHLVIRTWSGAEQARLRDLGWFFTVVKPDPVALGIGVEYGQLDFALACHERGWRALARASFRKWLARAELRAECQLAREAWHHWHDQLSCGAPLSVIAKHLKQLLPYFGPVNETEVALLRSLELALVPSGAAPGSDDALIDELIEEEGVSEMLLSSPAYRAIARRGFAAVPALIAHLGDDRFTRFRTIDDFMRVKDVVFRLICVHAGTWLESSNDNTNRTFAAGRWFAGARKMGEEEYLVAHIGRGDFALASEVLLPLLAEKYPMRLAGVYRGLIDLKSVHPHLSDAFAATVVNAPIPPSDKLKVLEYAATRTEPAHLHAGLHHLRRLDPRRADELLLAALDRLAADAGYAELGIVQLVPAGSDPKVWAALARAATRAGPDTRIDLLFDLFFAEPNAASVHLRVAFFAAHLADAEVGRARGGKTFEVRNVAAMFLDEVLGHGVELFQDRTPAQWAQLRERVRQAIEHESRR
jgi:hypothetical protein